MSIKTQKAFEKEKQTNKIEVQAHVKSYLA